MQIQPFDCLTETWVSTSQSPFFPGIVISRIYSGVGIDLVLSELYVILGFHPQTQTVEQFGTT